MRFTRVYFPSTQFLFSNSLTKPEIAARKRHKLEISRGHAESLTLSFSISTCLDQRKLGGKSSFIMGEFTSKEVWLLWSK